MLVACFCGLRASVGDDYKAAIVDRLHQLQNVTIRCSETRWRYPLNVAELERATEAVKQLYPGRKLIRDTGDDLVEQYSVTFRKLGSQMYIASEYRGNAAGEPHATAMPKSVTQSFSDTRSERLTEQSGGKFLGSLNGPQVYPADCIYLIGLGFVAGGSGLEFVNALDSMTFDSREDEISATFVDGNRRHRWLFSPAKSFALVEYRQEVSDRLLLQVKCSEFQRIENLHLPNSMVLSMYGQKGLVRYSEKVVIDSIELNDPANSPDSYMIQFPAGSYVTDRRLNLRVRVREGKQLPDELLLTLSTAELRSKKSVVMNSNGRNLMATISFVFLVLAVISLTWRRAYERKRV